MLQNPQGDSGLLTIGRDGDTLLQVRLENFRDLDYHFVAPVLFAAGKALTLTVQCQNTAQSTPGPCSPAAYYAGFSVPLRASRLRAGCGCGPRRRDRHADRPRRRPAGLAALKPVPNTVVLLSPGGGPGASTDATLAPSDSDVAGFASTVDHLVAGDGNGVADAFVNDHGQLSRISGDLPEEQFTGLDAGPALCGPGTVVAYGGGFRAPATPRRSSTGSWSSIASAAPSTPVPEPPGTRSSAPVSAVVLSRDCTVVAWAQDGDVWVYDRSTGAAWPCWSPPIRPATRSAAAATPVSAPMATASSSSPTGPASWPATPTASTTCSSAACSPPTRPTTA